MCWCQHIEWGDDDDDNDDGGEDSFRASIESDQFHHEQYLSCMCVRTSTRLKLCNMCANICFLTRVMLAPEMTSMTARRNKTAIRCLLLDSPKTHTKSHAHVEHNVAHFVAHVGNVFSTQMYPTTQKAGDCRMICMICRATCAFYVRLRVHDALLFLSYSNQCQILITLWKMHRTVENAPHVTSNTRGFRGTKNHWSACVE